MQKVKSFLAALCLLAPVMLHAGEIRVTGVGQVSRLPDLATVTLGVSHQAEAAPDAMREVAIKSGVILSSLKDMGIASRDMITSHLALSAVHQRDPNGSGVTSVAGYEAISRVTIRVRDVAILGQILGQVTGDGANEFMGLRFGLEDPAPALAAARKAAVADAQERAALYAEAAGVPLGAILEISEPSVSGPMPYEARMAMTAADMSMPIAEGEFTVTASVTMVFDIPDGSASQ